MDFYIELMLIKERLITLDFKTGLSRFLLVSDVLV